VKATRSRGVAVETPSPHGLAAVLDLLHRWTVNFAMLHDSRVVSAVTSAADSGSFAGRRPYRSAITSPPRTATTANDTPDSSVRLKSSSTTSAAVGLAIAPTPSSGGGPVGVIRRVAPRGR